jgi:hypothetical protein
MSFTYQDLLVDLPNAPRLKYKSRTEDKKVNFKWGQRKLLMHEMFFLTMSLQSMQQHFSTPQKITCIYVGAAPGTHIVYLLDLFPMINFKLYDARQFDPKLVRMSNDKYRNRLQLFSGSFFTNETATELKQQRADDEQFLFISDIRSTSYDSGTGNEEKQKENDELMKNDMDMQLDWHLILKPYISSLKFRVPFIYQINDKFRYLDGTLYFQCYTGPTSAETRLVTNTQKMVEYDIQQYEEVLFYHNVNMRDRSLKYYSQQDYNEVFDGSYDPSMEIYIWTYYVKTLTGKEASAQRILLRGLKFDQIMGRTFEAQRINMTELLEVQKERSLQLQEIAKEAEE